MTMILQNKAVTTLLEIRSTLIRLLAIAPSCASQVQLTLGRLDAAIGRLMVVNARNMMGALFAEHVPLTEVVGDDDATLSAILDHFADPHKQGQAAQGGGGAAPIYAVEWVLE